MGHRPKCARTMSRASRLPVRHRPAAESPELRVEETSALSEPAIRAVIGCSDLLKGPIQDRGLQAAFPRRCSTDHLDQFLRRAAGPVCQLPLSFSHVSQS